MFLWFFITLAGSSFIGIIVTFFVSCENQNTVEIEKTNLAERDLTSEETLNSDSGRKTLQMRMTENKALETQAVEEIVTRQL